MIIKDKICEKMNVECENIESCRYLYGRFGAYECEPDKKAKVEAVHQEELQERKELVKFVKKHKGETQWQQVKAYRDYKNAVIDKQKEGKLNA